MISKYDKICIEHALKKKDGAKLMKMFCAEYNDFDSIMCVFPKNTILHKHFNSNIKEDIYSWLGRKKKDSRTFNTYIHNSGEAIFFVELSSIKHLVTDFGKKHNRAAGYFTINSYGINDDFYLIKKKFYKTFSKHIKKIFNLSKEPVNAEIFIIDENFKKMKNKYKDQSYTSDVNQESLEFLRKKLNRRIILRIKQAKGSNIENVAKSVGQRVEEIEPIISNAKKLKLLLLEYDIRCQKCNKIIARVPRVKSIERLTKERVNCNNCNKPISSDNYEEVYIVPEEIQEILDGSKWMSLDIKIKLLKCGFLDHNILLEIQDGPNQLDVIGSLDGKIVLIECKDSAFSIGHAYAFIGKCTNYKPQIPIIITTEILGPEVKDYIKATDMNIHVIEKLDNVDSELEKIFGQYHLIGFDKHFIEIPYYELIFKSLGKSFDFDKNALEQFQDSISYPHRRHISYNRSFKMY